MPLPWHNLLIGTGAVTFHVLLDINGRKQRHVPERSGGGAARKRREPFGRC